MLVQAGHGRQAVLCKGGVPDRLSNGTNRGSAGPTLRSAEQWEHDNQLLHNVVKSINKTARLHKVHTTRSSCVRDK